MIQKQYGYSDRELVAMMEINEMIIAYNSPDDPGPGDGGGTDSDTAPDKPKNSGTIILDATCAP